MFITTHTVKHVAEKLKELDSVARGAASEHRLNGPVGRCTKCGSLLSPAVKPGTVLRVWFYPLCVNNGREAGTKPGVFPCSGVAPGDSSLSPS